MKDEQITQRVGVAAGCPGQKYGRVISHQASFPHPSM
jgi:hypothetical protein